MGPAEWLFAALKPSNAILLLVVAGLLISFVSRRAGLALSALGAFALLVLGVTPAAKLALLPLEERFQYRAPEEPLDGIVVLGGYTERFSDAPHRPLQLNEGGERLAMALELAAAHPQAPIILTGGGTTRRTEADEVARHLQRVGIAPERIVVENRSLSTLQNARFSYDLVEPAANGRYALITSAHHMPRSVATFRGAGWPEPIAVPVDYASPAGATWFPIDVAAGLALADAAAREWLATLYYFAKGRIATLWPEPAP